MNYKFILIDSGTGAEQQVWILPLPVVVGRGVEAEVSIGHPSISRRHCQFSNNADEALVVRDLDSTNGTYVDEEKVSKTVLRPGSLVRVGAMTLKVEWTTEPVTKHPVGGKIPDVRTTQPMRTFRPSGGSQ